MPIHLLHLYVFCSFVLLHHAHQHSLPLSTLAQQQVYSQLALLYLYIEYHQELYYPQ